MVRDDPNGGMYSDRTTAGLYYQWTYNTKVESIIVAHTDKELIDEIRRYLSIRYQQC